MIKILTVEREYGSGGGEIARLLADRLGWKLWDQLLTEEIARRAHCPKAAVERREERSDPLYYRLFKAFLRGSYEGSINAYKLKLVDSESIFNISKHFIELAADEGHCVIVGRGSQHFLQSRQDVFRVFLYAPREDKIRRVVSRGHTEREAQELVDTVDRDRADFVKKYFHVEWPTRFLYHVMLNTSVGEQTVVEMIVSFIKTSQSSVAQLRL